MTTTQDPTWWAVAGVPRRQEIEFSDGSRLWLHRVENGGAATLFVRELGAPAAGVQVDLRRMATTLASTLPTTGSRDVPVLVHRELRQQYASADAFIQAAVASGRPA